jgi:hypothetical protein
MKPSNRSVFGTLALIASAAQGCGPDHDRQMIYTLPRTPVARSEAKDRPRARGSAVAAKAPAAVSLPPSNGVDVPMIRPD